MCCFSVLVQYNRCFVSDVLCDCVLLLVHMCDQSPQHTRTCARFLAISCVVREHVAWQDAPSTRTAYVLITFVMLSLGVVVVAAVAPDVPLGGRISIGVGFTLIAVALAWDVKRCWIFAAANEWLLLIEDGRLIAAGIGTCYVRGWTQTVARFASSIHEVRFKCVPCVCVCVSVCLCVCVWTVRKTDAV